MVRWSGFLLHWLNNFLFIEGVNIHHMSLTSGRRTYLAGRYGDLVAMRRTKCYQQRLIAINDFASLSSGNHPSLNQRACAAFYRFRLADVALGQRPATTRRRPRVRLILGQRQKWWASVQSTLVKVSWLWVPYLQVWQPHVSPDMDSIYRKCSIFQRLHFR